MHGSVSSVDAIAATEPGRTSTLSLLQQITILIDDVIHQAFVSLPYQLHADELFYISHIYGTSNPFSAYWHKCHIIYSKNRSWALSQVSQKHVMIVSEHG